MYGSCRERGREAGLATVGGRAQAAIKDSFQTFRMSPRDVLNTSHVNV